MQSQCGSDSALARRWAHSYTVARRRARAHSRTVPLAAGAQCLSHTRCRQQSVGTSATSAWRPPARVAARLVHTAFLRHRTLPVHESSLSSCPTYNDMDGHPDGCTPSRQECGQKISKGDVRLGQEYNSRYGGVAWRPLACIGPHGQLIESDHRRKDGGRAKTRRPCPAVPPQYAVPYLRSVCPRRRLGALASRPSFVTL